jgi:hypothetical protein
LPSIIGALIALFATKVGVPNKEAIREIIIGSIVSLLNVIG